MSILKRELIESREFQRQIIKEIVETGKSVGLVLPTAAGKTIIALEVAEHYFDSGKILFLVPTTQLGYQHRKSVWDLTVLEKDSVVYVSGEISPNKRQVVWNKVNFYVATPQTVWNDIQAKRIKLEQFSLIIFDEMHLAGENYDYIPIAEKAKKLGVTRLGLTASPGGNEEKIRRALLNLYLDEWIIRTEADPHLKLHTFPKYEIKKIVKLTEDLYRFEHVILQRLNEIFVELQSYVLVRGSLRLLSIKELEKVAAKVNPAARQWHKDVSNRIMFSQVAEYYKLRHLVNLIMTENFTAAWLFLQKLRKEAYPDKFVKVTTRRKKPLVPNKASHRIVNHEGMLPIWKEVKARVLSDNDDHPKLVKLIELVQELSAAGKQIIIFSNDKSSHEGIIRAIELQTEFREVTESIFSKTTKAGNKRNKVVLDKFRAKELMILVSTSILEAGVHLPEVDVIINYSIPLEENTMIQRRGRVGRTKPGYIYYVASDHEFDLSLLFANMAKARRMQQIIMAKISPELERKAEQLSLEFS